MSDPQPRCRIKSFIIVRFDLVDIYEHDNNLSSDCESEAKPPSR